MPRIQLGMPGLRPGSGNLFAEEKFPSAARRELGNTQLRKNLKHATSTIRGKRLNITGELPDWEELRDAGSALKTAVMARFPELLESFAANVTARGGMVHWHATPTRPTASCTTSSKPKAWTRWSRSSPWPRRKSA